MSKEFGVSLTKDVTSFNSYRLTLEGAQNKQMKRGGVEIAHLFRIMDYVWGYNDRTAWNVETVIGLGGYTTQLTKDNSRHYAGGLFGGLHVSYLLGSHVEMFANRASTFLPTALTEEIPRKNTISEHRLWWD